MIELFLNILRGGLSGFMSIILIITLAKPKYGKKVMSVIIISYWLLDILSDIYFYMNDNLTDLAKFDVIIYFLIAIAVKPLFQENMMQWLFNCLTVLNVFMAIVVLSYIISRWMLFPMLAVTLLRCFFFILIIILFKRYLRPLYQQVVERWSIFLAIVTAIFINFAYYFMTSNNIKNTLDEKKAPLLLIIVLSVVAYITIFYFLKETSSEYALREENIRSQTQQELLESDLNAYEDYINISRQHRHDIRHHNAILSEYLSQGDVEGAREYLRQYDENIAETSLKRYCQNPAANAIFHLYESRALNNDIAITINADFSDMISLTSPELGAILSNILENAYEACMKVTKSDRFISFTSQTDEYGMKIELHNSVEGTVKFQNNLPVTSKNNGGVGMTSVRHIIEKHGGMLQMKQDNDTFITQIVLPL